jgi:hypothetical protein
MTDAELDQCRHDAALLRSIVSRQVQLKRVGRELKGCCPFHPDNTPSFVVYDDGRFHCFGCGADGTAFDYVMRRDRVEFPRAVEIVAAERGFPPKPKSNGPGGPLWQPVMPVPGDVPPPTDRQLACDALHEYFDAEDRLLHYVRRIEAKDGKRKQFYPLTYGVLDGKRGWHDKAPDAPKPLYRLNALSHAAPDAPVLVCEGETAANAAQRLFADHVAMTWSGGANADGGADFSPLHDRDVILWPDADDAGRTVMARIAKRLRRARILDTTGLSDGFDAADLEQQGCDNPEAWLQARLRKRDEQETSADERAEGAAKMRHFLSVETWANRLMPEPDRLLGDLVTTTTRMFLVGRTGLGKTHLGYAIGNGIATGQGFLHWRSSRPARVLVIDGEMPAELIKARSLDLLRRGGVPPTDNLLIFSRDLEEQFAAAFPTLGLMPPLNTEEGHNYVIARIDFLGGVDAVILDNVMSLIAGDQKDEIPWSETLPLVMQLTRRHVGQIWLDHTGHNTDRQYGSATKAWRMDAVGQMTPLPDDQRGQHEVAFTLSFEYPGKARRRTPENWADFESVIIRLKDDRWTWEPAGGEKRLGKVQPGRMPFYDALVAAIGKSSVGKGETTLEIWEFECLHRGLIERPQAEGGETGQQRGTRYRDFRKAKSDLLAAKWIGIDGTRVFDLKGRW